MMKLFFSSFSDIILHGELFNSYEQNYEWQSITDKEEIKNILNSYIEIYNESDDKETWFNKIKDLSEELGYSREVKEYKANPDLYKGHVGDISTVIRVALTGRCNTPDLYEIMQVLGTDSIQKRLMSY